MTQIAQIQMPSDVENAPPDATRSAHLFRDGRTGDTQRTVGREAAAAAADSPRARVPWSVWRRAGAAMGRGDTWGRTIPSGLVRFAEVKARVEQADRMRRRDAYVLGRVERTLAKELDLLMAMGSRFALATIDDLADTWWLAGNAVNDTEQLRKAAMSKFRGDHLAPRPTIASPLAQLALHAMRRDITIIHDILASPASSRSSHGVRVLDSLRRELSWMDGDTRRAIVDSFDWSMGKRGWFTTFVSRAALDLWVLEEQFKASRAASCCGCG